MTFPLRQFLACSLLAVAVVAHGAAEEPAKKSDGAAKTESKSPPAARPTQPAQPPSAAPGAAASTSDDVVTLPAVQVTRSRIRQIDVTIKRIDKLIARERKHLKTSDTDLALNHDKIANKAALFGGYSTSQRIAVASERVSLLESERELLEQMKAPMTKDDFVVVEKQVELLRTARRELDIVYR